MKLDLTQIVKRSWEITWKYKYLWMLGFIISLASGGSSLSNSSNWQNSSNSAGSSASAFSDFMGAYIVLLIIFALVVGFIMFVIGILSIMAQGGLISAAGKIERGGTSSLKEAFGAGVHYFWRMLGLSILIGLVIFAVVIVFLVILGIIALIFFAGGNQSLLAPGLACLIPSAILFIAVLVVIIILLTLISNYATRFIVLEDAGVMDGLRRGYALVRSRWLDTFVMYLVIAVITGVGGAILAIPGFAVALPSIFAVIAAAAAKNVGLMLLGVAGLMFAGLIGAAFSSIVTVYGSVAWTLTFLKVSAPDAPELPENK
jgi:hypothetical protein